MRWIVLALASAVATAHAAGHVDTLDVQRTGPDKLLITWQDDAPVDVLIAATPDAAPDDAILVSANDKDGRHEITGAAGRPYVLVRDRASGEIARAAERVITLERGSNFRDLGGYATADGHHVRWGKLFRAAATPLLSDQDLATIGALKLSAMIDLRSTEERQIAPTRLGGSGLRVLAVDYPGELIFGKILHPPPAGQPQRSLYRDFPTLLAPQFRLLFQALLSGDGGVEVNCSAGQDRTGVASALILSALGVPRDTIYADYLQSTRNRRPEYELPAFEAADFPGNVVAEAYVELRKRPGGLTPRPLLGADGLPMLHQAFDEIDGRWGSVENYLQEEIGLSSADMARLKTLYLE